MKLRKRKVKDKEEWDGDNVWFQNDDDNDDYDDDDNNDDYYDDEEEEGQSEGKR